MHSSMEDRLSALESSFQEFRSVLDDIQKKLEVNSNSNSNVPHTDPVSDTPIQSEANTALPRISGASGIQHSPSEDVQATFASIKASVQHIRLPAELTLSSSGASGLKKGEAQTHTIINKVARITETIFKVLKSKDDPYDDTFSCLLALISTLQDEQAALLVQSSFDPTVARFFRSLRRGGGFTPDAIEDLRSAASIAAAYRPQQQQQPRGTGRGQSFHFQPQRDFFSRSSGRGFPSQRGGRRGFQQQYERTNDNQD